MKKLIITVALITLLLPLMAAPKKTKNNTISNAPAWVKAASEEKILEVKNYLKIPSSKNIILVRYVGKTEQEAKANAMLQAYLNFFEKFTEEYNFNLSATSKNSNIVEYSFDNIYYKIEKTKDSNFVKIEAPGFVYTSENKKEYVTLSDSLIPIFPTELKETDLTGFISVFQKQFQEINFIQEGLYTTQANSGNAAFAVYSFNKKELQELADKVYSKNNL